LQETIKRTLEANPETPDFLDALHEQNISIRFKTNDKKEVVGISYGIAEKACKGSNLGTKFTWQGLLRSGLNYEFERDYEQLEEASRRGSRTESESAGSKLTAVEREDEHTGIADSREINHALADGITSSDRFGNTGSRREKDERNPVARIELSSESGRNAPTVESISPDTGTKKRLIETGDGPVADGHQGELQRTRRFGSAETEAIGGNEPADHQTTPAEDNFTAVKGPPVDWAEIDRQRRLQQFEEQQQQFRLFNQPPGSNIYSEPIIEPQGSDLPPAAEERFAGAGNGNTGLDGMGGISDADTELLSLADRADFQRNLAGIERLRLDAGDISTDNDPTLYGKGAVSAGNPAVLRVNKSPGGAAERVSDDSVEDLSSELRSSLDSAQSTVQETLEIEERTKGETIKTAELAEDEDEFEMTISRGRSM